LGGDAISAATVPADVDCHGERFDHLLARRTLVEGGFDVKPIKSLPFIATEMPTAMSSFVLRSRALGARADCAMLANAFILWAGVKATHKSWFDQNKITSCCSSGYRPILTFRTSRSSWIWR
jgi:hypothetical protein